ncbi:MAG: tripartite tricarboxylate transporter TctB family protein [Arenicella sp.]
MTLERALALFFLIIATIYGYTAFFLMDASLPPFAKNSPIWPSTFPKVVSCLGALVGLSLIMSSIKQSAADAQDTMNELKGYQWSPVLIFITMMVVYALLLRPFGFIFSSIGFLFIGALVLGEKRYFLLAIIASIFSFGIWYLVQEVLGIFLRPWPAFLTSTGG